jgi:hypothetical protein
MIRMRVLRLIRLSIARQAAPETAPPRARPIARLRGLPSLAVVAVALSASGCINWFGSNFVPPEAAFAPLPILQNNPTLVPNQNRDLVFETVIDVVDDYFKIDRELPVRLEGDVLVEGQIETFPRGGSTLLEPWNRDAANFYEKLEGTLQSIRRRAFIRVIPVEAGFLVDVTVFKELEDVNRPEVGSASRAPTLRNDDSLRRFVDPVGGQQASLGWIPLGRDAALEQEILGQLQSRLAAFVPPTPL